MEKEQSYAKINLSLDVVGKREDGYHDVSMVMQTVSLSDYLTLDLTVSKGLTVKTNLSYLPTGEKNLGAKAAKLFYQHLQEEIPPMEITIEKNIPVCAGLAGGSGDGAAVLRALHRRHKYPFDRETLLEIGRQVGADVPYCLEGGTMLAQGTGEKLSKLKKLPSSFVVLCKPHFSISTPELFHKIDSCPIKHRPDTKGMIQALEQEDLAGVARRMFNVFEQALHPRQKKTIDEIKNALIDYGALGASMSGSGPTVIGLFDSEEKAKTATEELRLEFPETFLTSPV